MDDEDEYETLSKKPLKLLSKEKKRSSSSKTSISIGNSDQILITADSTKVIAPTATKAEEAFKLKQEKIAEERILKKASKTHKQRVEEFNKHLDSLSEHYDIPKVSWTK